MDNKNEVKMNLQYVYIDIFRLDMCKSNISYVHRYVQLNMYKKNPQIYLVQMTMYEKKLFLDSAECRKISFHCMMIIHSGKMDKATESLKYLHYLFDQKSSLFHRQHCLKALR